MLAVGALKISNMWNNVCRPSNTAFLSLYKLFLPTEFIVFVCWVDDSSVTMERQMKFVGSKIKLFKPINFPVSPNLSASFSVLVVFPVSLWNHIRIWTLANKHSLPSIFSVLILTFTLAPHGLLTPMQDRKCAFLHRPSKMQASRMPGAEQEHVAFAVRIKHWFCTSI